MLVCTELHSLYEWLVFKFFINREGLEEASVNKFVRISELINIFEVIKLWYTTLQLSQLNILPSFTIQVVKIVDDCLVTDRDLQKIAPAINSGLTVASRLEVLDRIKGYMPEHHVVIITLLHSVFQGDCIAFASFQILVASQKETIAIDVWGR